MNPQRLFHSREEYRTRSFRNISGKERSILAAAALEKGKGTSCSFRRQSYIKGAGNKAIKRDNFRKAIK
jgi:hypothetical protein